MHFTPDAGAVKSCCAGSSFCAACKSAFVRLCDLLKGENNVKKLFIAVATSMLAVLSFAGAAETATLSQNKIFVNGVSQNISAYMIEGNNYFKLRDFAAMEDGTEK